MAKSEKKFWEWFEQYNKQYLSLDNLNEEEKEQLLDVLLDQLHVYCGELYFEIGGMPNDLQELIITAEGKTEYFEYVETLVDAAPQINGWKIIAFIQAGDADNVIDFEDIRLNLREMWFLPLQNRNKPKAVAIRVCAPNYEQIKESDWLGNAIYKALDTILGERSFALDIDFVDYGLVPENPEKQGMMEMFELPAYIKWKKAKNVEA